MPDSVNTWHKLDKTKVTQSAIERDRLLIYRLNKYDLNNFECKSENEYSTVQKRLELSSDEYNKELNNFYATSRNLNIVLVKELSDLRIGGKITLKCTNEGRGKNNKKIMQV